MAQSQEIPGAGDKEGEFVIPASASTPTQAIPGLRATRPQAPQGPTTSLGFTYLYSILPRSCQA